MTTSVQRWKGRSTFVTGHTGFKGGWLALWLERLGATVHGFALDPATDPSFFEVASVKSVFASDTRADLADLDALNRSMAAARPEVVFHLAAQPLVRESYSDPLGTLRTNVLGTAHVLEVVRSVESVRAVILVTTDKVYENLETGHRYRETDALGGRDPYSGSKAAAEIVAASYRSSFFESPAGHAARLATARAGNVIGGGDWAADRLVPDCLRAFESGKPVRLRYPRAVRPWQHVLEPLSGYLRLAEGLLEPAGSELARSWNFGPDETDDASVGDVADAVARMWGAGARVEHSSASDHPHEAGLLHLDSSAARQALGWKPRWSLGEALTHTIGWHRSWKQGGDMAAVSREQIGAYQDAAS